MAQLRLVLVTPETTLLDEPVAGLRFPLFDGQIGILPGRAPLVGRLGYGELKISTVAGSTLSYFIDGGFVQIKGETVTLLTNRAIPEDELRRADAQAQLDRATSLKPTNEVEFAAKSRDLERARKMLAMSRG